MHFFILTALVGHRTTFSVFGKIGFFNSSWWWNWGKQKKSPKPAECTQTVFLFEKHQNVFARSKIVFPNGVRQFLMPSKIVSPGDSFECHQKLSLQKTILGAIKNRCAQRKILFWKVVCDASSVSHKKTCARKKNMRMYRNLPLGNRDTQQLTKNNVFRKKLVYIHIRKNSRCAIFAFCVDFLPNRTRVDPKNKNTKKGPNNGLLKNRGSTNSEMDGTTFLVL